MAKKKNVAPRNLQEEIDAQDDAQKPLLGPNSSLDDKAVEAIASETAKKLAEMTPGASAVPANPKTAELVQMMREVVVSLREVTQYNQKVMELYRSAEKLPVTTPPGGAAKIGGKGKTVDMAEYGERSVHTNPLYADVLKQGIVKDQQSDARAKPHKADQIRREGGPNGQTFKRDDPHLYQATWGTQPINGSGGMPTVGMHINSYSPQDARAEDWLQNEPFSDAWVHDSASWGDPSFRGRMAAARGIGRGGQGRGRPEPPNWIPPMPPIDEGGVYQQPLSPLRSHAPPYVPLQAQAASFLPPQQFGVHGGFLQPPMTQEAVADMNRAALTQRDAPPVPLLQKPYPDWVDREHQLPRGYRIPNFIKFSGNDDQRPTDHLARFELQCGGCWSE